MPVSPSALAAYEIELSAVTTAYRQHCTEIEAQYKKQCADVCAALAIDRDQKRAAAHAQYAATCASIHAERHASKASTRASIAAVKTRVKLWEKRLTSIDALPPWDAVLPRNQIRRLEILGEIERARADLVHMGAVK